MTKVNNKEWVAKEINIKGNKIRLLVSENNNVDWLVLWGGLGATAEEFTSILKQSYTEGINVISLDPPGHGYSDSWSGIYNFESVELILNTIFDEFKIQSAFIGGHSYGAYVTLASSLHLKDKVKGVILLDGAYSEPYPEMEINQVKKLNQEFLESRVFDSWEEFFEVEKQSARLWDEDIEEMLASTMQSKDGKVVPRISLDTANQVSSLLMDYKISNLGNIDIPILLLYASLPSEYKAMRSKDIDNFSKHFQQLCSQEVPNSSHDLLVDNPKYVTEKVFEFINKRR